MRNKYPSTGERVVKKWIEVEHSYAFTRVENYKRKNGPMTWLEALSIVSPETYELWDQAKSYKKYSKQMKRASTGVNRRKANA